MSFDEMLSTRDSATRTRPERGGAPVGRPPQVSLLPREIRDAAKSKVARRALAGGLVAAVLLAGGMVAGASMLQSTAQTRLDDEAARTQTLALEIAEFADVQRLQQNVAVGEAAAEVGSSTRVDWQEQLDLIRQDMPYGYSETSVTADAATPIADYVQGAGPLDEPRAATVTMAITAPSITELPIWLRKLRSIPSYADAGATVDSRNELGEYTLTVVVHLSEAALESKREEKQP